MRIRSDIINNIGKEILFNVKNTTMTVAKVIELIGRSGESFEDAIRQAIEEAKRSIRNIRKVRATDFEVIMEHDNIVEFQVAIRVTFEIER